MKICVITGTHRRHLQFVSALESYIQPAAYIFCRREEILPQPPEDLNPYLKILWRRHFAKRAKAEHEIFTLHRGVNSQAKILEIPPEDLNKESTVNWYLSQGEFDAVFLAGCPIVKDPFFGFLPEWRVNLHMGIIPQFKGTITPFWTHYLLRPHWNGCTYHTIDRLVDTGAVLHQTICELNPGDGLHESTTKMYLKACNEVKQVLELVEGSIALSKSPCPDTSLARRGFLFTNKDWHAGLLRLVYETYQDRVIDYYLDGRIPQIEGPKLVRL